MTRLIGSTGEGIVLNTGDQLLDTGLYFSHPHKGTFEDFPCIRLRPVDMNRWKLAAPLLKSVESIKLFEDHVFFRSRLRESLVNEGPSATELAMATYRRPVP